MKQYNVTGMSCAACVARVENAINKIDGVESCSVSLLTNSMGVEGDVSDDKIIKAVIDAGYGASLKGANKKSNSTTYDDELSDIETPVLIKRLIASVVFLLPLMYVSMGHMMWNWPLPEFIAYSHVSMGIYELLLTIIVMLINKKFFISGIKGFMHKSPNMDSLVAMGAGAAFLYSLYALFAMSNAQALNNLSLVEKYMDEMYFESSATILTLITVGKTLEAASKGKTTDALKALMKLTPKTAIVLVDKMEKTIPVAELKVGDTFIVKPGNSVPVDGVIIEGNGAVDESAITGESIPVDKTVGDQVSTATINTNGYLICKATKVGEDTSLAKIIQMVSDVAATKAPIAKIADKVAGVFVPAVITIATITFVVWILTGAEVGFALARAISVLVISCPCSLGLATPVAIMVGNGLGAKHGIMYKNAAALEESGRIQIVAFDKTGTITTGKPKVVDIALEENVTKERLITLAASLEKKSEHPLAVAVMDYANELSVDILQTSEFELSIGNGLSAVIDGAKVIGGNEEFIRKNGIALSEQLKDYAIKYASLGQTPLFFAADNKMLGIISVADVIKSDSADAISRLNAMGIHTVMLTGDNERTANAIGKAALVDEVLAGVKPDQKAEIITALQSHGKVAMVGDGINDALALTKADIGIAIGAGTDIAIDAADVVLMKNSLMDAYGAIKLSQGTLKNIHENLFWAFFYNSVGIPIAAGVFIKAFGLMLSPMIGAAAMGLSSFCVVTNALRLNLLKVYNSNSNRVIKNSIGHEPILNDYIIKEVEKTMEITVNGMMCKHCEKHVKDAIEKIDGVVEAVSNHETNSVVITTSADVKETDIKAAVEDAGYEYVGIK